MRISLNNWLARSMPLAQILFGLIWLTNLANTDAYFSVYVIISFLSFFIQIRKKVSHSAKQQYSRFIAALAILFSGVVLLANYPLFTTIGDPALIGRSTSILVNCINGFLSFIGGICVIHPILCFFFSYFPVSSYSSGQIKIRPLFIFLSFLVINLVHLFLVEYPGNATEDTFTQISEMISGSYSNFNTFWHTMIFELILRIGYGIFRDINASIALFCVLQTIVLAFAFTYTLVTMQRFGVPKVWLLVTYLLYGFLPYHIALSVTIWKDVLFSAGCVMMLASFVRILWKLDDRPLFSYLVFFFGSVLFLLSRTIGWMIYIIFFLVSVLLIRKNRKLVFLMGAIAILGWFLLNPALSLLHVSGGDMAESFSIPIQQVSRVVADGCNLTQEEEELLSHVVDLEQVPELYTNWLSDPMKVELRSNDYTYFQEHLSDYFRLWVRLGARYPWEYVKAWVDQTKGYWNAGYDYPLYSETITDNPYGVEKMGGGNPVASLFRLYFGLSRHVIFFEPFHSIGLHVWILILCFLLNVLRRRDGWLVCIPLLVLVAGLWIGTPVFCSFRYVYPLFVSFPLILTVSLVKSSCTQE